jgi:TctA family transporter
MFDVHLMLGVGVVGYFMMKLRFRSRPFRQQG